MAMKFRAHDTFFIRKGWLSKGMKYVSNKPDVFIDKNDPPMDVLGIGSNMVKALRYWLQTVGLTTEPKSGRRTQRFTELGKAIFEHDRFIEELAPCSSCNISSQATKKRRQHGTISSMNLRCPSLPKRTLWQVCKALF